MVHNGGGTDASGEVTAVDETTMEDGDLEDAVGLLTQLEVLPLPPHAAQRSRLDHLASVTWPCTPGTMAAAISHADPELEWILHSDSCCRRNTYSPQPPET